MRVYIRLIVEKEKRVVLEICMRDLLLQMAEENLLLTSFLFPKMLNPEFDGKTIER